MKRVWREFARKRIDRTLPVVGCTDCMASLEAILNTIMVRTTDQKGNEIGNQRLFDVRSAE